MKKALSMPVEIIIAVFLLVVIALAVVFYAGDEKNKVQPQLPISEFGLKCTAFCESKNFTYVDTRIGSCLCMEPHYNTLFTYVYDKPKNIFINGNNDLYAKKK